MSEINGNTRATLTQVIQRALEKNAREMHVALPATVVTYKITSGKICADVQITIQYEDAGEYIDFPRINNVPVQLPSGNAGQAFLSMPIQAGDSGLLIACDYGIDGWKSTDGDEITEPSSIIRHSFSHAIFIPGVGTNVLAYSGINDDEILMKNTDGDITVDASGDINITGCDTGKYIKIGNTTTQNPVIASSLNVLMTAILTTINGTIPGVLSAWTNATTGYPTIVCNKIKIPPSTET